MGTMAAQPGWPALANTFHIEAIITATNTSMTIKKTPPNRTPSRPNAPAESLSIWEPPYRLALSISHCGRVNPCRVFGRSLKCNLTPDLRGAFAAAEFEGEGVVVAPVLVELRKALGGFGEIGGERAESLDLVAHHVGAEGFAFGAVGQEVIQNARDRFGRQARRNRLDRQAEAHDAVRVVAASEQHLVVRDLAAL